MLSLYIHIPFCAHKCEYCSFHVMETSSMKESSKVVQNYLEALHRQIDAWGKEFQGEELRTIYFGGGTPSMIGSQAIIALVDHIAQYFSLEYLEELSIEVNPYPESILDFMDEVIAHYNKKLPRIRFSVGIQSFDNSILKESGREYTFAGVVDFLRNMIRLKKENVVFNFDFIAFGKFSVTRKGAKQLRHQAQREFFQDFVESGFADGFSLYTLELFAGSKRYHALQYNHSHAQDGLGLHKFGDDEDIYAEFDWLKQVVLEAGYERYEISNFSSAGRNSIHNRVYWSLGDYIGLGTSASGFFQSEKYIQKLHDSSLVSGLTDDMKAIRWTNTKVLKNYLQADYVDGTQTTPLSSQELKVEQFFLALRTSQGVSSVSDYAEVLENDWQKKCESYHDQGFMVYDKIADHIVLSDTGMDIYNEILTELVVFD